ncbi:MAG: peptidase MA family metallohydrolase [Clostridia bacterium]|jgi:hypothetical protein|nr:peptidase MA family metallohydrolase [Clostridia bacterium]
MFEYRRVLRIFILVTIAALFLNVSAFLSPSLRAFALQGLQEGVKVGLDWQTRDYQTVSTENFIIKYTPQDEDIIPKAAEVLEDYYTKARSILAYGGAKPKEILVIVYPNQDTLNSSFGMTGDKSTAGIYWAGTIRLLSPRGWSEDAAEAELKKILRQDLPISHELTHFIVDEWTRGNYSRWLTEGLAQYVEEKVAGFTLEEPGPDAKAEPYGLTQLESGFDSAGDQTLAYWQSLQAVAYLIDQHGADKMGQLLDTLRQGAQTEEAIRTVYGLSYAELEQESL